MDITKWRQKKLKDNSAAGKCAAFSPDPLHIFWCAASHLEFSPESKQSVGWRTANLEFIQGRL
jgi:hypothetical protein